MDRYECRWNARYYAMLHYAMVYIFLYTMYTRQMRYSK